MTWDLQFADQVVCTALEKFDETTEHLWDVLKIRPDKDIPDLIQSWWQISSKQNNRLVHIHYSLPKNVSVIPTAQLEWKTQNKKTNFTGRFKTDTSQVCEREVSVFKNPYSVQDTNRNLGFQGLTTGSAVISCLGNPFARPTSFPSSAHPQRHCQFSAFLSQLLYWHKWQRVVRRCQKCRICKDTCGY